MYKKMMIQYADDSDAVKRMAKKLPASYIMIVLLMLSLGLGACVPRSKVGGDMGIPLPEQESSTDGGAVLPEQGAYSGAKGAEGLEDLVEPTEVLDLALPSQYENGKSLTPAERQALLTVSSLDRNLSIADYEMIMPYFAFYTQRSRVTIQHMVKNASPYLPYVRKVFRENGIPEELAYLGMIESVYRPAAVSRAGAAGVWQFMPSTGKAYGLKQDWWVDERRDVYKATLAAVKYLKVLYNYFDDWLLVMTAYNAGEGTVLRALKETNTDNFFDLARKSKGKNARLKLESQRYAPSFLAVTKIMRNLELLGFDDFTKHQKEIVALKVPAGTDLLALTNTLGVSWADFSETNAAFKRYVSPPDGESMIYLDATHKEVAQTFLAKPQQTYAGWSSYKIKKGDTLGAISKKSGVPVAVLSRVNNVSPNKLRIGSTIMIPSKASADLNAGLAMESSQSKQKKKSEQKAETKKEAPKFTGESLDYIVKNGDTLYAIAHAHDLGWKTLMEANGLNEKARLRVGQHLSIPQKTKVQADTQVVEKSKKSEKSASQTAQVPKQESTQQAKKEDKQAAKSSVIAALDAVGDTDSVAAVGRAPSSSNTSQKEKKASVSSQEVKASGNGVMHKVQKDETLYSISRMYHTDVETLMKLNNISDVRAVAVGRALEIPSKPQASKESVRTYTVQSGDSLWSIARQFNMSTAALIEQNDMTSQTVLQPGDVLKIVVN